MKAGKVLVTTVLGGLRWARFAPQYSAEGEIPLFTTDHPDGVTRWYGSGTAELVASVLPITVRVPVHHDGRRVRWSQPAPIREEAAMALRKVVAEATSPGVASAGATDAGQWPNLLEHMTMDRYPDGSARKLSCVVITAGPAGWQGCVSDKDNGRVMWKTAATLEGLLLALEDGLAADDPSTWRQSADTKFRGKKRS